MNQSFQYGFWELYEELKKPFPLNQKCVFYKERWRKQFNLMKKNNNHILLYIMNWELEQKKHRLTDDRSIIFPESVQDEGRTELLLPTGCYTFLSVSRVRICYEDGPIVSHLNFLKLFGRVWLPMQWMWVFEEKWDSMVCILSVICQVLEITILHNQNRVIKVVLVQSHFYG